METMDLSKYSAEGRMVAMELKETPLQIFHIYYTDPEEERYPRSELVTTERRIYCLLGLLSLNGLKDFCRNLHDLLKERCQALLKIDEQNVMLVAKVQGTGDEVYHLSLPRRHSRRPRS